VTIQSVDRAAQLLVRLAAGSQNLTELSAGIGIGMPGTLKILRTLTEHGLVTRSDAKSYSLGVTCCALARGYLQQQPLAALAPPVMEGLAHRLDGRTVLAVLREGVQVNLLQVDPHGTAPDAAVPLRVGTAWPQATGRVLLAFASPVTRAEHFARYPLPPGTPADKLLAGIRQAGYAVVRSSENLHFLAAPVRALSGEVVAALGANAPDALPAAVASVLEAAAALSARLGWE